MQPNITCSPGSPSAPARAQASHALPIRVYYEDTDAGGVVYYANYLKFCERGRTEWLRALGVGQQALLEESGIAFMVRSLQADYRGSARLDDTLQIVSRIGTLRRASIQFEQQALRDGELLFSSSVIVACVDVNRHKPTAIPAPLYALLESQA